MRRRSLILENKIIKSETSGFSIRSHGRFTNQIFSNNIEILEPFEPFKKNRFIVDLEIDSKYLSKKIPNSRVSGFSFNIVNSGYKYDVSYDSSEILKPRFFYKII